MISGNFTHARSVNAGSPAFCKPISVGIEGPNISRSSMPTRSGALVCLFFRKDKAKARFTTEQLSGIKRQKDRKVQFSLAMVLFPTPPFPLAMANTF